MAKKADEVITTGLVDSIDALTAKMKELREAQAIFSTYTQEQVDKIFFAAAMAANKARIPLAKMAVAETGMGIVEDHLPRIFERFYRADRARSREEGGSGLGLAIAHQLALAHDGQLEAANSSQGGAVFTLTLPVMAGGEETDME